MTDQHKQNEQNEQHEPTFYELLGVDREAAAVTIRRAWRKRTKKAQPGTGHFRRLNEAAETLLDPRRRLEYDASLPAFEPEPERSPVSLTEQPADDVRPDGSPAVAKAAPARRGLRTWIALGVLVALTVAAAVLAGIYTYQYKQDQAVEHARTQASRAAEQALGVVLSYDYRHMDADEKQALSYLTPAYGKKYAHNFDLLTEGKGGQKAPVQQTKTVVQASVLGTGVMDASTDQVHVMAFVNQRTRHHAGPEEQRCTPACVLTNRVAVTMVQRDGEWLVDGLNPR